jgi:hypothetical protein
VIAEPHDRAASPTASPSSRASASRAHHAGGARSDPARTTWPTSTAPRRAASEATGRDGRPRASPRHCWIGSVAGRWPTRPGRRSGRSRRRGRRAAAPQPWPDRRPIPRDDGASPGCAPASPRHPSDALPHRFGGD